MLQILRRQAGVNDVIGLRDTACSGDFDFRIFLRDINLDTFGFETLLV
ncbi:MAG: hypothetical protein OER80_03815 [Gammaproteobacteria bacterium]|nr:hypothetical protein [Gammaproteobacteria bacterium]MDH3767763.1 hypothetical protein [Gammaproteobacteria bacterium]